MLLLSHNLMTIFYFFSEGAEEEAHPSPYPERVQQRPLAGTAEGTAHQQGAPRAAAEDQEEASPKEVRL